MGPCYVIHIFPGSLFSLLNYAVCVWGGGGVPDSNFLAFLHLLFLGMLQRDGLLGFLIFLLREIFNRLW